MEKLCLSGAIMALKRTPAEKILLAYISQQAATSSGQCTDSNKELGQAVAMHPQTVSDLIGRLVAAGLVLARIDKKQANKRNLRPQLALLEDYRSSLTSVGEGGVPYASSIANEAITLSKRVTNPSDTKPVADEAIAFLEKLAITPTVVHSSPGGSLLLEANTDGHYYLIEFYPEGDIVFIERSEAGTQTWVIAAGRCAQLGTLVAPADRGKVLKTWLSGCRSGTALIGSENP